MQLSTIMLISVALTSMVVLLVYTKIRTIGFLQNKSRLLFALGIIWVVVWFVMCYIVAIGMYLIDVVV